MTKVRNSQLQRKLLTSASLPTVATLVALPKTTAQSYDLATEYHPAPVTPTHSGTRQAALIARLSAVGGATLAELAEAFGWLPHSTRAALSGLRKKGHAISRAQCNGEMRYWLATNGSED